ncbi:MAG: YggS family pyridoxal phosphate-dependent enzyme [Candidatus Omnitrophica bacterium CG11_big_fil_rev_8_21_14_0_20_42_13]|uniref:Pyridoxal phosphate homeostasis protein n=1 Tax=Candidatus Ghiorseimicrobium undicola TaxID=1974746 RepID=A0A2H0LV63_9BACT|nr:MAG: YggS family pyridoxal phosphate-dependent enzyme [Candidatus Omnitrophica bacterium CG11_big_fil_rev_8_21_14_0_20_42_13]
MSVKDNILGINNEISSLCLRINRDLESIKLIAVTKEVGPAEILLAIESGITDIGENKVQEALNKYNILNTQYSMLNTLKWHMIGHLQTNKAKDAVKIFDLIHSVDSLRLADEINKQAEKIDKIQDILIEVNTSGEKTKFGLTADEAVEVVKKAAELKSIRIQGLMTIAPLSDNPESSRPYFRILRELRGKLNELRATNYELRILSMGMSQDYKIAIEEGATMIRVGRVIFKQ